MRPHQHHAFFRRCRVCLILVAGAAVLLCWLVSVLDQIPSTTAVAHERAGIAAVHAGRWDLAMREFGRVVALEPRSTWAHFGRACALMAQGQRSGAGIEYTKALQDGLLLPSRSTPCPRSFDPRQVFTRVTVGTVLVIVVPRSRPGSEEAAIARAELAPSDTDIGGDPRDARREMAAACMAWRAKYYGLAFQYGRLAAHPDDRDRGNLEFFLRCVGSRAAARDLKCAAVAVHLPQCAFLKSIVVAMNRDDPLGDL